MIDIEKRKFLTELGKLLTFMYDEDRQTALSMYGEMFDRTDETEELMKLLVSPTRQAVLIARAYNAKERDLAIRSRAGDGDADVDSTEIPRFVKVIGGIAEKAEELLSPSSYSAVWDDSADTEPEDRELYSDSEEPESEAVQEEMPADPFAFVMTDFPVFQVNGEDLPEPESDKNEEILSQPEPAEPEYSDSASEESEEVSNEEHSNRINEYMASFADADKEDLMKNEAPKAAPAQEEIRTWRDRPVQEEKKTDPKASREESSGELVVPLLILYILLSVPITAIGVLLLMIPAVLCLAISLILIVIGFQAITTAFGGFAVFADIMVVLGGALVIIAIALCALWAFIWFIGGAIVSLINGAIRLGGRFCTSGGGR